jgi:pimeloyl-ACP methyl ester carboxylesterase
MLTIVLLPGMEGSGLFFSRLLQVLGTSVATHVVSYPFDKALNYAELANLVEKSLPKDSPYVMLGESFSGPIAITLAAAKPVGLQAVILVGTFVCSPIPIPTALHSVASQFPIRLIPKRLITKFLLGNYSDDQLQAQLMSVLAQVSDSVWQERLRAILTVDVKKELSEIAVPILYMRATQDKIVPKSASELVFLHRPDVVIAEIAGPHFMLQTNPEASAAAILKFLRNSGSLG